MKTDRQLQQDIVAELSWDPAINAARIGVEVKDGIVTLAGHVDSFAEKWEAEKAAQRVAGVKALAIEIDVTLPGTSMRLARHRGGLQAPRADLRQQDRGGRARGRCDAHRQRA